MFFITLYIVCECGCTIIRQTKAAALRFIYVPSATKSGVYLFRVHHNIDRAAVLLTLFHWVVLFTFFSAAKNSLS